VDAVYTHHSSPLAKKALHQIPFNLLPIAYISRKEPRSVDAAYSH
jgi:hypothetical protein